MSLAAGIMLEIMSRLIYSVGQGQCLDGFKLTLEPVEETDGIRDFPHVVLVPLSVSETGSGATVGSETLTVGLEVMSRRAGSQSSPEVHKALMGEHFDDLASVKNAIELNTAYPRLADGLLGGLLRRQLRWGQGATKSLPECQATRLTLELDLPAATMGAR